MRLKLLLFIFLTCNFTYGQQRINKIDSLLNSLYQSKRLNGNILIAEKGKIIYNRSFGIANETTRAKLNQHSIFELASCSKQFTAMGIVILKEKGRLNFDDHLTKYIPELANFPAITIKQLLLHTSGLPDYMSIMEKSWDKNKIASNNDMIRYLSSSNVKLLFEPNTKHEYSNTGYALLATIIERISNQSYADFLSQNIFKPLKMKQSFVYQRRLNPKRIENYAFGYIRLKKDGPLLLPDNYERTKMVYWLDGIVGDGTVNSTVIDLLKWDRALYTSKLVLAKSINEIFTNGILSDGSIGKHGYGWRIITETDNGKIAKHSGAWPGYVTYIERDLTHDKTIIILQNHNDVIIPADQIRQLLYETN